MVVENEVVRTKKGGFYMERGALEEVDEVLDKALVLLFA